MNYKYIPLGSPKCQIKIRPWNENLENEAVRSTENILLPLCVPARWPVCKMKHDKRHGNPTKSVAVHALSQNLFCVDFRNSLRLSNKQAVNNLCLLDSLPSQTLSEASGHPAGGLMTNTSLCWGWARKMCYLKRTYLQTVLPQLFSVRQRSPVHLFRFLICLSIHLSFFL